MRNRFRLLPLSLCIALALPAYADEESENWGLCPIEDAVPAFADVPESAGLSATADEDPTSLPTDIGAGAMDASEADSTVFKGDVELTRGDQFLGTDKLVYDTRGMWAQ